jgi:hypothetical protein
MVRFRFKQEVIRYVEDDQTTALRKQCVIELGLGEKNKFSTASNGTDILITDRKRNFTSF